MLHFPRALPLSRRLALRLLTIAGLLVACDPLLPTLPKTPCDDGTSCSERAYRVVAWIPAGGHLPDSSGGVFLDSLPVVFTLRDTPFLSASAATCGQGERGAAWALSCVSCGERFRADSVFFTTDFYGPLGDTLRAGVPVDTADLPSGVVFRNGGWLQVDSGAFRDSVFEVRFVGRIDSVAKNTALRVTRAHRIGPSL